ncbi:hypothetical protein BST11_21315 [Mycobacterium alsense]|uniref:PE family protein n=1 Tax=Mycobacterium alsense TaxID=324058 RepID=A0AA41XV29_9MYCO|nr:PE family protein [Mycobacterium alsense]MCV7381527.1 PE family protein [Mycobacterium alsense]OQZ88702.1 hypothetical protein BST11_21315 [Mycobacterium alsense]
MSYVSTTPEEMQAAARNLAGIRSMLAQSSASVAAPTVSVVAAAQDQVSVQVAAFFGGFGQEYQAISAGAQAFHEQFANLVGAGAGAYLGTELANAQQNVLNAVNAPVQGLLAQSAGAGAAVGAAASGMAAAPAATFPLLGGVGAILRAGGLVGQGIGGFVTALQNGGVVPLLSGQLGWGLQSLSGGIVGLPVGLTGLERALGPGLLVPAAGSGVGSVAGPYQTLFTNAAGNLQALGTALAANPAPFLHQFVANQFGYAQTIAAGAQYIIQNFPAVVAGLPANVRAFVQALLAFNPVPYVQEFIAHQLAYAQIVVTSLQNAANDFGAALQALPSAFQSAVQALQMGDITGAVTDVARGFVHLFVTGVGVSDTGTITSGITATITPAGTGDLLPILTIPGMMAQNFTNLLPPGSIPAQVSQNITNVIDTVFDTSLTGHALPTVTPPPPPPIADLSVSLAAGLPVARTIEALGAPYDAASAIAPSAATFVGQVQTGNLGGALGTLADAPAVVTDAFLNGQSTLPIGFDISGMPAVVNFPMNGLLFPQTAYTATVAGVPFIGAITVPVGGAPISGLLPGLLSYLPQQLALAITPAG